MDSYYDLFIVLTPWLSFVFFALCAKKLIASANKRKGIAVAFGVLVQMFLPDPQVEKTIETVIVEKRAVKKQQQNDGDK